MDDIEDGQGRRPNDPVPIVTPLLDCRALPRLTLKGGNLGAKPYTSAWAHLLHRCDIDRPFVEMQRRTEGGRQVAPRRAQGVERIRHQRKPLDAHVPVQDMAELMSRDPLELIPRKLGCAPPGDSDDCVFRGKTGCKCIDAILFHHVNRWNGCSGCDGHFLHHVSDPSLVKIFRIGRDQFPAQGIGHGRPTRGERDYSAQACQGHDDEGACPYGQEEINFPSHILKIIGILEDRRKESEDYWARRHRVGIKARRRLPLTQTGPQKMKRISPPWTSSASTLALGTAPS